MDYLLGLVDFFSVILICLIWGAHCFPSHLYNVWVMTELANAEFPLFSD